MTRQPEPPAPASRAGSLVAAAVAGLVLVALLIGIGWWRAGQDAAVLATGLPSGLPVGRLEGSVDYDDLDLDDGRTGRIHFFYVVNEDGTGTFRPRRPLRGPLAGPVRRAHAGAGAGHE